MKLMVFSVYDSKVGAYQTPFFLRSKAEAIRAVTTVLHDKNSNYNNYPADYTLFYLGEFDDVDADFNIKAAYENLGSLITFIEQPLEVAK